MRFGTDQGKASSTITPIVIMNGDVLERVTKHEEAAAKKRDKAHGA
ncbi:hypothetical protein PO124_04380 [Bacillus licheniformis]|nr:hypothetical protein [Bacillus licheniformis]